MKDYSFKDSENFYKKIFESIYDGIAVVDKDCNYLAVNPAYLRLTGFSEEEIIGQNLLNLKDDAQAPYVMKTKIPIDGIGPSLISKKKHAAGEGTNESAITANKNYAYTSVAPIMSGEECIGSVTTFKVLESVRRKIDEYARGMKRMQNQIKSLHQSKMTFDDIIGESPAIKKTVEFAHRIAKTETSVLLLGESGTGKEVFAQAIHNSSQRAGQPFVTLNCPCLPENLVESELFGYEEGAFSGAIKGGKIGLCELADNGTLFLDEIGDLSLGIQTKILRFLENGQFLQVGGRKPIQTNVRTIAATNRNLEEMIRNKQFREDLYYRLCVVPITIPPLRKREKDVIFLAQKFIEKFTGGTKGFDQSTLALLEKYSWPGNVRELRNTILAMVNITDSSVLKPEHLPERLRLPANTKIIANQDIVCKEEWSMNIIADSNKAAPCATGIIFDFEKKVIADKLKCYGNNGVAKKRIAQEMGISLSTLYNKIRYYGLNQK